MALGVDEGISGWIYDDGVEKLEFGANQGSCLRPGGPGMDHLMVDSVGGGEDAKVGPGLEVDRLVVAHLQFEPSWHHQAVIVLFGLERFYPPFVLLVLLLFPCRFLLPLYHLLLSLYHLPLLLYHRLFRPFHPSFASHPHLHYGSAPVQF